MARRARLDEELSSVGCVIFDELHFLNDPERGPVWEEAIIHSPPHVIFVTAYDEHAIRAFEVRALDYLLKPVSQKRFDEALERAAAESG